MEMFIQSSVEIVRFRRMKKIVQMSEILIHPDMYVLILHISNVYSPRTSMDETRRRMLFELVRRVIAIDRFVFILDAKIFGLRHRSYFPESKCTQTASIEAQKKERKKKAVPIELHSELCVFFSRSEPE